MSETTNLWGYSFSWSCPVCKVTNALFTSKCRVCGMKIDVSIKPNGNIAIYWPMNAISHVHARNENPDCN